jgi:hypothetical protein
MNDGETLAVIAFSLLGTRDFFVSLSSREYSSATTYADYISGHERWYGQRQIHCNHNLL